MKRLISILTAIAIVYGIFTPFKLFFSGGQAILILIPTVLIILHDKLLIRRNFVPIGLYIFCCFLLFIMGSKYFQLPALLSILFGYSSFEHYMVTRDHEYAKIVYFSLYSALLIMVFISLPLFFAMPNLSRLMLDTKESGITQPIMYFTISYQTIHELPIYSIPLFYFVRNGKKTIFRFLFLISILAIFVLMLFADSTGALIINIIVFSILLLYNQRKSIESNIVRLAVMGVTLILLLNKSVIIGFLTMIQPVFLGSSTYAKINEIIDMINGGDSSGDLESRGERIDITMNSILSNPLYPTLELSKIGQHNVLIDHIAAMGLFLGTSFVWFIIERIKRPIKSLSRKTKPYYLTGVLAFVATGFAKNFFLFTSACCILPMILIASDNNESRIIKI